MFAAGIVDIQLLSDVSKQGWRVEFSGSFMQGLDAGAREQLMSTKTWTAEDGSASTDGMGKPQAVGWRGAVVAVLGNRLDHRNPVPCDVTAHRAARWGRLHSARVV